MNRHKLIDWPYVLGLLALPLVLAGLALLAGKLQQIRRYDPMYFRPEYTRLYPTPDAVLYGLEIALRDGDQQLMDELLATRRGSQPLAPRPKISFVFLAEPQGEYLEYLFLDLQDYSRVVQYVRPQGNRYIAAEADFYFFMDSGKWLEVAGPLAALWWLVLVVFTAGVYVYRRLALAREAMWRGQG
jgi:hypothetical protein